MATTRKARILVHGEPAGVLEEIEPGRHYRFSYYDEYPGPPASLTLPLGIRVHDFDRFPPFFEGLLPEGVMLEALLKRGKIDADDYFSQLVMVGADLVGAVTLEVLLAERAEVDGSPR